jgi:tRNA(Ile)-lysidine synthase
VAALSDPAPKPRTLGGCRIVPWQGRLIVLREAAAIAPDIMLGPGETLWDGRFRIRAETGSLSVGALRLSELAGLRKSLASGATPTRPLPPRLAWPTLPGLRRDGRLVAVPALGWVEPGENAVPEVRFVPNRTLSGSGFTVV